MSKILIGLHGPARSGKTSVGNILCGELGIPTYALAAPLKDAVNGIFGWDKRHAEGELKEVVDPFWNVSPRRAYQTLGTEWGRNMIRDDLWLRRAQKVLNESPGLIVTDIRFPNEAAWLAERGGLLVHIRRPDAQQVAAHASEAGLNVTPENYVLSNTSTLNDLIDQAIDLAHYIKRRFAITG